MTTIDLEDARWRAALDAELCCEATQSQRQLLVDYKPRGAEHRAEHALMSALGERPSEDGEQDGDESLLAAVMESLDAQPQLASAARAAPFAWGAVLLGAAAAVVTVGIGLLALGTPTGPQSGSADNDVAGRSVVQTALADPSGAKEVWNIASGSAVVSATGGLEAELPTDAILNVTETLCTSNAGTSLCAGSGSQMQAEASGSLALLAGSATLRTAEVVRGQHVLGLGDVTVDPAPHSVVMVERQSAGWSVHVERGSARVLSSTSTRVVGSGETLEDGHLEDGAPQVFDVSAGDMSGGADSRAKSGAARPKVSALLAEARAQRRDGELRRAIRTYQRLIENHPRSPAAQTARLSVGQLQLDAGSAKAALRSFRGYLRKPGALREDAAYGEIRALRRLGRVEAAQAASDAFKARYPSSRYGTSLNRDLK